MLNFRPSSLFFTPDNIDSGGEGIYGVYKEWSNKWIKRLLKAPVLNKCVNYNPGQNVLGHLRKWGAKTHLAY